MRSRTAFNGPQGQVDMPFLLTAGPVTTSQATRLAALADWGIDDADFLAQIAQVRASISRICNAADSHDCVLFDGPAPFAIEAALGSFTPARGGKTLVLANGASGDLAANILQRIERPFLKIDKGESAAFTPAEIEPLLEADRSITHLWLVHSEIGSGLINPAAEIAQVAKRLGRTAMVDATATLGALPLDLVNDGIDVLVSTSENCLESLPGLSCVVAATDVLNASMGKSHSLVLDVFEQWRSLVSTGRFRFTPPTHLVSALHQALLDLHEEGGAEARLLRYRNNADIVAGGLKRMGFVTLLAMDVPAPLVVTVLAPRDPNYDFASFSGDLFDRGFAIAPGRLARRASFRIGLMGQLSAETMSGFVDAVADVVRNLDIRDCSPVKE